MAEPAAGREAGEGAARLRMGTLLDACSLALSLLALVVLLLGEQAAPLQGVMLLVLVLGGAEKYYAIRVAFDRRVFADWAARWQRPEGPSIAAVLAGFDEALTRIGRRPAGGSRVRSLGERLAGAFALLRRQSLCLFFQVLLLLATASFKLWRAAPL